MRGQWKKKLKRIAVLILTAALLVHAVDYNQLFVKAEEVVEQQDSNSGNDNGANDGSGNSDGEAGGGENDASGDVADDEENTGSGDMTDDGGNDGSGDAANDGMESTISDVTDSAQNRDEDAENGGNQGSENESVTQEQETEEESTEAVEVILNSAGAPGEGPQTTVEISITVKNDEGSAIENASVIYRGEGSVEETATWSDSSYKVTISEAGTVTVKAAGYEEASVDVTMDQTGYEIVIHKLPMKASWKIADGSTGSGQLVDSTGKKITSPFILESSPVSCTVKADEDSYIAKIEGTTKPASFSGYPDEVEIKVSEQDEVAITFSKKRVLTIEGTNLNFGTITLGNKNVSAGQNYFTPDNNELKIIAGTPGEGDNSYYISNIEIDGQPALDSTADGKFVTAKSISLADKNVTVKISYSIKWGKNDLKAALVNSNSDLLLSSLPYNAGNGSGISLKVPDETYGYTIEWQLKETIDGVTLKKENGMQTLLVDRKAQGKKFKLQGTASLDGETINTDEIEAEVASMAARADIDYKLEGVTVDGVNWLNAITVFENTDGENSNGFNRYALILSIDSGNADTKLLEFGREHTMELKETEDSGAVLLLATSEVPDYQARIENLYIDTKGPELKKITVSEVKNNASERVDSSKYTGTGNILKTKYPIEIKLDASDNGSGLASVTLIYIGEGNKEAKLTSINIENGTACFDQLDGRVDYSFTGLILKDKAGNETSSDISMNFSIDTDAPEAPSIGEVGSGTWVKGKTHEYLISSSEDTVQFVICEDDGKLDWEAIEKAVEGGSQEGFLVINATVGENGESAARWNGIAEDNAVFTKKYQIKALDDHGNFSVNAAEYEVKIDNQKPSFTDIAFSKEKSGNEIAQTDAAKKINDSVVIVLSGVSDGSGSGIDRAVLIDEKGTDTELTLNADKSAAELILNENKEYRYTALRVYDNVGNYGERECKVRFSIDTAAPGKPEVTVSKKIQEDENGWLRGNACTFTITSKENAADTYCFEIYEKMADGTADINTKTELMPVKVDGEQANVEWNVPVETGTVFKKTYLIKARDCEDTDNSNYSEIVEYTVKIDNRQPDINEAAFQSQNNEGTNTAIVTDEKVVLSFSVKDGTNPPEDESGLKVITLEYKAMEKSWQNPDGSDPEGNSWKRTVTLSPENGKCTMEFPAVNGKYIRYSDFIIIAEDQAGNKNTDQSLLRYTAEIDRRGPVIESVEWNVASDQVTYWYNENKAPFQFRVKTNDDTKLKTVTVCAANKNGDLLDSEGRVVAAKDGFTIAKDGSIMVSDQAVLADKYDFVSEGGKTASVDFSEWVYNRKNTRHPDKKEFYTIWVTDQFGNITIAGQDEDISPDKAPREVRIDVTRPVIETDESDQAKVTYDFGNVKQPNAENVMDSALNADYLVNGKLLSKEDIKVKIQAYDPGMNANSLNKDGVASGIIKAELTFLQDGVKQVLTQSLDAKNPEQGSRAYVFELKGVNGKETVFMLQSITLTDLAGNKNTYYYRAGKKEDNCLGALTAVVDHKLPEAAFRVDAYSYTYPESQDITGWYSAANGKPVKLTANAVDAYGVYTIQWYKTSQKKGTLVTDADKLEETPDKNGKETEAPFVCSRELKEDQNQLYAVKVTDWAGNEFVYCADRTDNEGSRIRIDNAAPDKVAFISWNDGDGSGDGSRNAVGKGEEYEASTKEGMVYNKTKVTLHVYVRDTNHSVVGLVDAADGRVSSGIQKVDVTVNFDDKEHKAESRMNDRNVALVEINNSEYLDFSFDINWTNSKAEIENSIDSIVIYDNAGNRAPAETEVLKDKVKYILDDLSPELTVDYHSGGYVENALFPDTYFYDKDPGINAVIRERYFFTEDVKMQMSVPEATGVMDHSGWSMGGVEHGNVFSSPGDGKYRFSIDYTDRSGNPMIGENVEGGVFTSKTLVMDTTVPEIEITYEYNGHDVTDEIYDGNFFAGTVTATVRITEMNFDPDQVEIEATGKSSGNNGGVGIGWDGDWTQEGSDVQVNRVTFDQQGTYQFTCTCRDIVGHEAERPAQSLFVVDTTRPEVEITYDLNEPSNEKYYKETRTATVRVTDRSFDPDQVEFIMESSGPQPVIGEWAHIAGGGCENEPTGHVDHCVYEAKLVYEQDGDYSLGFRCTDKAGNESEQVMTDPFTVDQTLPEMTVNYDNNDVRNDHYYNAKRIGTIQITEHNFNPEDVQIITSAQNAGAGLNVPGNSGWRTEGDVHTTTIVYDYDADFSFDISYIDLAGNEAEAYTGDRFVVDMTAPLLEITDIEDKSANNETVAPGITYSDVNLDTNGVNLALTGANNGETTVETTVTGIEGGLKIQYHDFPRQKELDDLYTFHATVTDLAGNVSEQTVLFSVNRFGSVYVFDEATQSILDRYYINEPAHLNVTEINVDSLKFREITYSKGGDIETMKAGEDYTVTESGSDVTWKSYTYDISDRNFTQEGAYTVTIYSEDRATNKSNNIVKEKNIDFVMDTTAPTVVVTGVDDREQYNENSRVVTIDAKDNIYLAGVTAYLDDLPVQTFDADMLAENDGVVTMEITNSNEWQKLYVRAMDAAGNEENSDTRTFLITKNLLVQWYRNVPLFYGSIGGAAAIAALGIYLLFYKKKQAGKKAA